MQNIKYQYLKTDLGELVLASFEDKICLCDWRYRAMRQAVDERLKNGLNANFVEENTNTIEHAKEQLLAYLNHKQTIFEIPLLMVGTDFQQTVWKELLKIPYGKTVSYLELSMRLQNPKAIRAVASANGANAISIFIPCHRIIGSNGELTGYAGGLPAKQKLLQLENKRFASIQEQLF